MENQKKVYNNVKLGENVIIEDFCVIGCPPQGYADGELETSIGDNAVIRSHTVIYAGNKIGNDFKTGHHVVIREHNIIGDQVSIGTLTCLEHHLLIEDHVRIHSQAFIPEYSILKAGCWIGPNVVITNAKYPLSRNVKAHLHGAVIESRAKVGANVTLLPGVKVGKEALIGAGSVVVKDVADYQVVAGNPARLLSDIRENNEYQIKKEERIDYDNTVYES